MTDGTAEPRAGWRASVIIPAHDEANVLSHTLGAITDDPSGRDVEVIVVANGCTDRTAEVARSFSDALPGLVVEDLDEPSKVAALNRGDELASTYPRVYLDADIVLSRGALSAMIDDLAVDVARVAAPRPLFDTSRSSRLVKSFYSAFAESPYVTDGLVGLGVYGLSAAGRARFASFPDLTADDLFVQRLFAPTERVASAGWFRVTVPRRLVDLVRVRTRVAHGNRELARVEPDPERPAAVDVSRSTNRTARFLREMVLARPASIPSAIVFVAVALLSRYRARSASGTWLRDDSTRTDLPRDAAPTLRVAYLVSQYPAPSHVFIEREVVGLRERGASVETFSVRPAPEVSLLSQLMRDEDQRTIALLDDRGRIVRSTLSLASRHPVALARVLRKAMGTGEATVRSRSRQLFYLAEAVRLHQEMRDRGLRHVHVHFGNNGADVARLAVALGRETDGVDAGWMWTLTIHGPGEFAAVERMDLAAKVRDARAVACISDFTRSQLMRLVAPSSWEDKFRIVRMSVDVDRFVPPPDGRAGREGPLRVLYVGRLVPEKAAPVLLDAVRELVARHVDITVRLIGSGVLEPELRRRISSQGLGAHVEMVGAVGQDEIRDHYWWADAFCLPSFQEGLPVVLMEALATELPVVTTYIAGIPELVAEGVDGFVVPAGRADLVADRLEELARDPDLRRRLGSAGRTTVCGEFSVESASAAQHDFLAWAQSTSVGHR